MDIKFEQVGYTYQAGTPMAAVGLQDVSFTIRGGDYTAIIGQTGSGKSTLLQHLNALLKPTTGTVTVGERVITGKTSNKNLRPLRQKVGMVFQFAESQLFESTVARDVAFGPQNFGVPQNEALELATRSIERVGLPADVLQKSPFDLSGGQMRRVAIAGVLAMQPEILVLDEPTAGLDPRGRREMMALFARLHAEGQTVVLVTHQMDDVADFADKVLVMDGGKMVADTTPRALFQNPDWLLDHHLGLPKTTAFARTLQQRGFRFDELPIREDELVTLLKQQLGGRHE